MSVKFVDEDSFVGFHLLNEGCFGVETLNQYIEQFHDYYLRKLLGQTKMDELLANADNAEKRPTNADILAWFDPFCEESPCNCKDELESKGIPFMLTGLIYYEFTMSANYKQTASVGTKKVKSENANDANITNSNTESDRRWNDAYFTFKAIWIKLNGCCKKLPKGMGVQAFGF
mgnify:CR=1 FL=1